MGRKGEAAYFSLYTLIFIPSLESPELKYLQLAHLEPLLVLETTIVNSPGQAEAALYPTPGVKTKMVHATELGF